MKDVLKGWIISSRYFVEKFQMELLTFRLPSFLGLSLFVSSSLFFRNQIDVCVISSFTRKSFL